MITAAELAQIPVFAGLDESECQRFAQKAADIRVEAGDWVIREGEDPRFFVVLEGLLQAVKDIVGQRRELDQVKAADFFGEIPILLGTANLVSVQALSRCRLARFDRQQLQELIRVSASSGATIFQTMTDRLSAVQQYVEDTPSSRVVLIGSQYDAECRAIRSFLSANRVQYDWVDRELSRSGRLLRSVSRWSRCGRRRCAMFGSHSPHGRRGIGSPDHVQRVIGMTLSLPVRGRPEWPLESMERQKD